MSCAGMDFQWKDRNLSDPIKKKKICFDNKQKLYVFETTVSQG